MSVREHALSTTLARNDITIRDTITNSIPIVVASKGASLLGYFANDHNNSRFFINKAIFLKVVYVVSGVT